MPESVYIHIPFCKSKCNYCSFVSFNKLELKPQYLKSVEKEIKNYYQKEHLKTLYFGGGTPSNLSADEFFKLIELVNINVQTEVTTELNPEGYNENSNSDGLTKNYLKNLNSTGINRISLGVQTFDDGILKILNRRHNSANVYKSVENAYDAGFENISLDFIYGLPNQTCEMFIEDLKKAVDLGVVHISLYGLSIEEGCYFYYNRPKNVADDEKQADMYIAAVDFLVSQGFEHYEISNFAKQGYSSKHNLNYWDNKEYYGFGVSAHGYIGNTRYSKPLTIEEYINNPFEYYTERIETDKDKLEEEIFLGLRKMSGINVHEINKKFDIDFEKKYYEILKKYTELKLLKKTTDGYAFTLRGVLLSNTILADFLE